MKYSGHANHVYMVEDAESSRLLRVIVVITLEDYIYLVLALYEQ